MENLTNEKTFRVFVFLAFVWRAKNTRSKRDRPQNWHEDARSPGERSAGGSCVADLISDVTRGCRFNCIDQRCGRRFFLAILTCSSTVLRSLPCNASSAASELLLARLMGQYCFTGWRLQSCVVVCKAPSTPATMSPKTATLSPKSVTMSPIVPSTPATMSPKPATLSPKPATLCF